MAVIIPMSGVSLVTASAQSSSVNWGTDGNYGQNWNYVSQSQLNSSTSSGLHLSWVFPVPPAPPPSQATGISTTPVVENGIAYFITNYATLFAVDSSTGALLWSHHIVPPTVSGVANCFLANCQHYHNSDIFYSTKLLGQPLIWFLYESGFPYTIYAFNAISGSVVVNYTMPISNLPGVRGTYALSGRDAILDQQSGTLIIGTGSISEAASIARGFFIGVDVATNPPHIVWETPVMPPQDGSNPNWDVQSINNMSHAWIFNGTAAVNLKALSPSVLNATFYNDWALSTYYNGTNSFAGTSTGWGGPWAVDPTTGIAYVTTDQASPDWNATFRPGPNLWSDSVIAVNITNGNFIWAFQATPHDLQDYDCSWSVLLANATLSNGQTRQEVLKGCKNGYFYALNPTNGSLLWYFNPPNIIRENTQIANPLNRTQMTKPWEFYPASSGYQNPCDTGGFESDPSYNPATGLVYVAAYNCAQKVSILPVAPTPGVPYNSMGLNLAAATTPVYNTTIWALNAVTGQAVWHYFIPNQGYRGGTATTGNLLIVPLVNGSITVLNAADGSFVNNILVGAGMDTQPAIASNTNGQITLFQPIGSSGGLGIFGAALVPGDLVALTVKAPVVQTVTKTVTGPSTGISPTLFYGVAGIAAVLAIIAIGLGVVSRRRPAAGK